MRTMPKGSLTEEGLMFKKVGIEEARESYQEAVDRATSERRKQILRDLFKRGYGEDL